MNGMKILTAATAGLFLSLFSAEGDSNNLIRQFSGYAPLPPQMRLVDPEVEKRDYDTVKNIVSNVEAEYMRHLSTLLGKEKADIDRAVQYRTFSTFIFSNSGNYYESVSAVARKRDFMNNAMSELDRAEARFAPIRLTLPLAGINENDVKTTGFKMLRIRGILYILRGGIDDFRKAADSFETILTNSKEALSNDDVGEVYTYLVSVYDQIYQYYASSAPQTAINSMRKELLYIWKLVLLKNGSNEKLRDVKLLELVKTYYVIIDYDGLDYKDYYKPYVEKLGLTYNSVEKSLVKPSGSSSTNK